MGSGFNFGKADECDLDIQDSLKKATQSVYRGTEFDSLVEQLQNKQTQDMNQTARFYKDV